MAQGKFDKSKYTRTDLSKRDNRGAEAGSSAKKLTSGGGYKRGGGNQGRSASGGNVIYRIGLRLNVEDAELRKTKKGDNYLVLRGKVAAVTLPNQTMGVYIFDVDDQKAEQLANSDYVDVMATKASNSRYWSFRLASEAVSRQLDGYLAESVYVEEQGGSDNPLSD